MATTHTLDDPAAGVAAATPPAALGPSLLDVVSRINRLATQRTNLPLPYAQARLLSIIEQCGIARISQLAELDHCAQPTMTAQVRRLEDAALVTRITDPGDARAVLISITPAGIAMLTQVRADRASVVDPYLTRLSAQDRQTLAEALGVLQGILDSATDTRPATPKR